MNAVINNLLERGKELEIRAKIPQAPNFYSTVGKDIFVLKSNYVLVACVGIVDRSHK